MTNVSKRRVFGLSFVIFSLISGMIILSSFSVPAEAEKDKVKVFIGLKNPDKISIQNIEDIKEKKKQMKEMKKQMKDKMDKMEVMVKSKGGKVSHNFHPFIDVIAVSVAEYDIEEISKDPNVLYIEEDAIATIQEHTSSDLEYLNSWGVDHIEADFVATMGNSGAGIKVAILDTGIDYTHPDLNDNYVPGGPDLINNDGDPMDDHSHGTHVAGTVAAEYNGFGVVGVGPEISLYAVKVLNSQGFGSYSAIVSGIQWAADNVDIASMSFGGGSPSQTLKAAVEAADAKGLLMIAAAGNSGNPDGTGNNVLYPALYDEVIAVASTNQNDERASDSSTGSQVEISAPGVGIYSTILGNNYGFKSGTSMATPHVSGVAALVMNSDETCWQSLGYTDGDGTWTHTEVRAVLDNTADYLGNPSHYGFGLVDPDEAAQQCSAIPDTTLPVVTPPADIIEEATSASGATVNYPPATATDDVGVTSGPTCTPASGSTFAIGNTIVTCTAEDAAGNIGSATFTITVQDTTAPVVTPPADVTQESTSSSGATVNYPAATATDDVGVTSGPTCTPASGTTFPLGDTTVTCTAEDAAGNIGSATFTINVEDTIQSLIHYKLENDLTDSGSLGLDAAWNAASGSFVTGAVGRGIDIEDSTAEFITVPDNPLLNFGTDSFTVMFWTEFDKNIQPKQPRIANKWDSSPGFLLFERDGNMRVRVEDNLGNFKAGTFDADIGDNVFHHVALVVDRNTDEVRLYTDGIQRMTGGSNFMDISSLTGSVDNTLPLNFGGDGLTQRNLDGKLDEIQVTQRVLTDEEILATANIP